MGSCAYFLKITPKKCFSQREEYPLAGKRDFLYFADRAGRSGTVGALLDFGGIYFGTYT